MEKNRYDPKLKPYNKKLTYSYTFGVFPTLDLLKLVPDRVLKVLINTEVKGSDGEKEIIDICHLENIPVEYNDKAIEKIAYKENTYAIGIFEKYEKILNREESHVVLLQPSNMGNLGTLIRTMVGFGMSDLAIIRPAADIFAPKVVRAAMGAMFNLNFRYFGDFAQYRRKYPDHNLYPFMLHKGRDIRQVSVQEPFSLIFGNEGRGLSKEFADIGQPLYSPQTSKIDSLNLSIAAGVAMWHFSNISGRINDSEDPPVV